MNKIYDIAGNSKRGKDPNEFSNRSRQLWWRKSGTLAKI